MDEQRGPVYDDHEYIFHRHYEENYTNADYPMERYETGYRYGFHLAQPGPPEEWADIEEQARRGWEAKEVGPWADFKDAVRHAWETAKEAMNDET